MVCRQGDSQRNQKKITSCLQQPTLSCRFQTCATAFYGTTGKYIPYQISKKIQHQIKLGSNMNVGARTVVTFIQRSAMVWAKRRTSNWFVKFLFTCKLTQNDQLEPTLFYKSNLNILSTERGFSVFESKSFVLARPQ